MNFESRIRAGNRPLVIDGGLATELERRGHDVSGPLWSARLLLEEPGAIEQLHRDYFAAGAECVISASYQASAEGFALLGLTREDTHELLRRSVRLAAAARESWLSAAGAASSPRFVAASVGPFGATRHDGSEYHGNYGLSVAELRLFHEDRMAVLAASGADVLACETIPSLDEARALADLLRDHAATSAWMSFTSADGVRTAHGEPLADCARLLDDVANVVAIGVNCLHPTVVSSAIRELRRGTDRPIVVYPNSGERWNGDARRWEGPAAGSRLADLAREWTSEGARIVGGCCRTGPDDISNLAKAPLQ